MFETGSSNVGPATLTLSVIGSADLLCHGVHPDLLSAYNAATDCVCRDLDEDSDDEEGGGEAIPVPGVLIFAINAPMYFANVQV